MWDLWCHPLELFWNANTDKNKHLLYSPSLALWCMEEVSSGCWWVLLRGTWGYLRDIDVFKTNVNKSLCWLARYVPPPIPALNWLAFEGPAGIGSGYRQRALPNGKDRPTPPLQSHAKGFIFLTWLFSYREPHKHPWLSNNMLRGWCYEGGSAVSEFKLGQKSYKCMSDQFRPRLAPAEGGALCSHTALALAALLRPAWLLM